MSINWEEQQNKLLPLLLSGDTDEAMALTRHTLDQGAGPNAFFEHCITPVMIEIGNRFETLEIFLPEMVVAAEVVQEVNNQIIAPALKQSQGQRAASIGKVLLATVQGDLHDIGKSMVALMLRVNGFEVVDLGIDVPPATVVDMAEKEQVDIVGLSALLTTCLPYMKDTVEYMVGMGLRDRCAVVVGGAAPTAEYAQQIGVDAYGGSAAEAVAICRDLMKQRV